MIDRGQLIYAMALIDKQRDKIDRILALESMTDRRVAQTALRAIRADLRATMDVIHQSLRPGLEQKLSLADTLEFNS